VGIELVSPSGTLSKVQTVNNAILGSQLVDASLGVNSVPNSFATAAAFNTASASQGFDTARDSYAFDRQFPSFGVPLLSNAFFHESARGVWKLRLVDGLRDNFEYGRDTTLAAAARLNNFRTAIAAGRVTGYKLTIFGHAK